MASFQAKIGWEMPRKIKNKIIPFGLHFKSKQAGKCREIEKIKIVVPFRTNPMRNRKFQKTSKKIQKIKKYHYGVISSQNWLEKAQREKIKIIVSFRSALTLQIKFKKNSKKIQ